MVIRWLLFVLLLAWPSAASASSIHLTPMTCGGDRCATVYYEAVAGEANRLQADLSDDGQVVTVRDLGAPVDGSQYCVEQLDGSVRCATPWTLDEPVRLVVTLDDRDDAATAAITHGRVSIYGGDGADMLRGTGSGEIALVGDAGDDHLVDDDGKSYLEGGAGRDRLEGGAGIDIASWQSEKAPVTVDLRRPQTAGTAAEPDALSDVEGASGGAGDDLLIGTDGADFLDDGSGDDRLIGLGGDDQLETALGDDRSSGGAGEDRVIELWSDSRDRLLGGAGDDLVFSYMRTRARLIGGPGDDLLSAENGSPPVSCGAGTDRVIARFVPLECERATLPYSEATFPARLRLSGRSVLVPVPDQCGSERCRVSVELIDAGDVLLRVSRTVVRTTLARVRIAPRVRRRLLAASMLRLSFTSPDGYDEDITVPAPAQ